jgi:SAM-dependent methyltransferase
MATQVDISVERTVIQSVNHTDKMSALMPPPDIYELEYAHWPWGVVLESVAKWTSRHAPKGGCVLDYLCGTGYLLNLIKNERPDVDCRGCSLDASYIDYGQERYAEIRLNCEDALRYKPGRRPDIILCTAGFHHLDYQRQLSLARKLAGEVAPNGYVVVAEEVIRDHRTESQRRDAVTELWCAVRKYVAATNPPRSISAAVEATFSNDLAQRGEYKVGRRAFQEVLESGFLIEDVRQIWPAGEEAFGDFVFICRSKSGRRVLQNPSGAPL